MFAGPNRIFYLMMLDTTKNYILEDERVLLRPLLSTDFEHLLYFSEHEPTIWTYSLISAASPQNLAIYIQQAITQRDAGSGYPFIVFDKTVNRYAGCTRFYDVNNHFSSALIGYTWYGEQFQGTGINQHCKNLLLRFAFETCKFERIEFRADAENKRSMNALIKISCIHEGILRSHMPRPDGTRRDTAVFSIIKKDWLERLAYVP